MGFIPGMKTKWMISKDNVLTKMMYLLRHFFKRKNHKVGILPGFCRGCWGSNRSAWSAGTGAGTVGD
jgi:hypothetical protein